MMGRWLASTAILVLLGVPVAAKAGERGPVCRQLSVVDEMTREVRDRDYYAKIDPGLVTETPTTDVGVVRCQVCVQTAPYNMTRFGDQPVGRCLQHGFEVRILRDGFVVRDLQSP